MTRLQITARGQITLKKTVLEQLGVGPGDQVDVEQSPDGGVVIRPVGKTGTWADLHGMFAGAVDEPVSIEEMNRVAAAGWAGEL